MPPATSGRAAIPQNAGLRKSATRFKDEALISYPNRTAISRAPKDHMFVQCVVIIAFRTNHYAFNCKRVDLSANVPCLQHGRPLLSLPSRSWLPLPEKKRSGSRNKPGLAKQVSSPALTSTFKKACAPFTDVSPFFLLSSDVGLDAEMLWLSKSFAHKPLNLGEHQFIVYDCWYLGNCAI
jgi:hypothetical protein